MSVHEQPARRTAGRTERFRYDILLLLLPLPLVLGALTATLTPVPMVVGLSLGGIPSVVILAYGLFVAAPVAPGPSQ